MSDKAFRQFVTEVRDACDRYLRPELLDVDNPRSLPMPTFVKAPKKATSVKGNPRCKCGHMFSVHDAPRDNAAGKPENICRGCDADGSKIGCPEFVSKRGGAIVTTREPGVPPKQLNGAHESADSFQPVHLAILAALKANSHQGWTAQQISILTVYTQSGTFNMALADLREMGLIAGSPASQLTPEGVIAAAGIDVVARYSANGLRLAWSAKLGQTVSRVLETLAKHGAMSVSDLAERSRYTQSGTFNQTLAKLRRMGLIQRGQPVRLGEELT